MTMQESVNSLKFHHQYLPDKTVFEKDAFSESTITFLTHRKQILEELTGTLGRMDCILITSDGRLEGGADPRGDNTAGGF
jgi:gamma-glutamyltranspeptidase/glutathione hydrolase